jgi:hypothetical protein
VQRLSEKLPANYKSGMVDNINEFAVLQSLYEGLESMLSGYGTSQEDDNKLLKSTNFKLRCAGILRTSEKEILKKAMQILAEKVKQLIPQVQ